MSPSTILHVGTTKTGSTSIQNFLDARRQEFLDQGVLFPASVFTRKVKDQPERTSGHLELIRDIAAGDVSAFERERKATAHETLLLSAENIFHHADEASLAKLRMLLGDSPITLVAVLRRQDAWLASFYGERVRGGWDCEARKFDRFAEDMLASGALDYVAGLERMERIFRPETIRVIDYDRARAEEGVLAAFLGAAGLPVPADARAQEPRSNISRYSAAHLEAHRRLNPLVGSLTAASAIPWCSAFKRIETLAEGDRGYAPRLSPPVFDSLCDRLEASNRLLSARYLDNAPFGPRPEDRPAPQTPPEEAAVAPLVERGLMMLACEERHTGLPLRPLIEDADMLAPMDLDAQELVFVQNALREARTVLGYESWPWAGLLGLYPVFSVLAAPQEGRAPLLQSVLDRIDMPSRPQIFALRAGQSPFDLLPDGVQPDLILMPRAQALQGLEACRKHLKAPARVLVYAFGSDPATPVGAVPQAGTGRLELVEIKPEPLFSHIRMGSQIQETVLPYKRGPGPFRDLLVISGTDAARPAPLPFLRTLHLGDVTIHADAALDTPFKGLMLGIARHGKRLVEGPIGVTAFSGMADLSPLGPACLCRSTPDGGVLIEADAFGLYPIYYGRFGGSSYAANRLDLLLEAAHRAGHRIAVNARDLCTRWFLDSGLCLSQTTPATLVDGVSVLLPRQSVTLGKGAPVLSEPVFPDQAPLDQREYETLVIQGAEDLRANIEAVATSGRRVTASLTGGRDSRMIYAAILSLGLQEDIPFHTLDIEQDKPVAEGLLQAFGGRFDDRPFEEGLFRSFPELLGHQIGLGLAAYDDIPVLDFGQNRDAIHLEGGCGELYRALFSTRYGALDTAGSSLSEAVGLWLDDLPHIQAMWPTKMRSVLNESLAPFLSSAPVDRFSKALDWHYGALGCRFQFGASGIIRSAAEGPLNVFPLCSLALLEAAWRMPAELRQSGRLVFDVTRALNETLAYMPYDTPDLPRWEESWHRSGTLDHKPPTLPAPSGVWEAAQQARYGTMQPPAKMTARYRADLDMLQDDLLDRLRQQDGLELLHDNPALDKKLAWYKAKGHRYGHVWTSRLASVAALLQWGGGVSS